MQAIVDPTPTEKTNSTSYLQTSAADEDTPAIKAVVNEQQIDQWQEILDDTLIPWGLNPQSLADDDEGIEAPPRSLVSLAYQIAMNLCRAECPAPNRIIPDGDGGFVLKWWDGKFLAAFEISPEGTLEYVEYEDGRVVSSKAISPLDPAQ